MRQTQQRCLGGGDGGGPKTATPRAQGPRAMGAEVLPRMQARGSPCQLPANRACLCPSEHHVEGKKRCPKFTSHPRRSLAV